MTQRVQISIELAIIERLKLHVHTILERYREDSHNGDYSLYSGRQKN